MTEWQQAHKSISLVPQGSVADILQELIKQDPCGRDRVAATTLANTVLGLRFGTHVATEWAQRTAEPDLLRWTLEIVLQARQQ